MKIERIVRMNKKRAFTLAEVLVTLAILGVVAAIIIPNVTLNYKEKATITHLKKVYSQLQNAYDMATVIYGDSKAWDSAACDGRLLSDSAKNCINGTKFYSSGNGFMAILEEFLPVAKKCSTDKNFYLDDGCYLDYTDSQRYARRYLLSDGTFLHYNPNYSYSEFRYENSPTYVYHGQIMVDLNGKKSPNTEGIDKFAFYLTSGGIIPMGGSSNQYLSYTNINGTYNSHDVLCKYYKGKSTACTRWAIEKGNMDYLGKRLDWE